MKHVASKAERDKQVIEAVVRRFGPISRVEIHQLTHLRSTTISGLVQELLNDRRLLEVGRSNNPIGRKQILLQLNKGYRYVVGIEFDDESVLATLMDLHPEIRNSVREPAYLAGGAEGLTRQLIECTRTLIRKAGMDSRHLVGLGIADPGLVNSRAGITVTSSTIDFWKDIHLKDIFEKTFGISTLIESKTRARTVAERALGSDEPVSDMAYIDYGTGIGAGLILDGRLVHGHRWAAGEFGHTHMIPDGPACKCGSFGCLEAIVGASAVEARVRRAIDEGARSRVAAKSGGPSHITVWDVLTAAREGDKTCLAITEQIATYLGLGLANLVNLFNPSMVVLDHRLGLAGSDLVHQIARIVKRQALSYATEDLTITFAKLGENAGVLGVALMVLEKHFEIPALKLPKFMIESPDVVVRNPREQPA